MPIRTWLAAVTVLALLTSSAAAQTIDADIQLRDVFQGVIADSADIDVVSFDGLAGEVVTLTVVASKKSALRPMIVLTTTSDPKPVAMAEAATKKALIAKFPLPATGSYAIRVAGLDGTTGAFVLRTRSVVPKALNAPVAAPSDGLLGTQFDARPGTRLTATVRSAAGSDVLPALPELDGPTGTVDLSPFTTVNKSGTKVSVKKAVLDAFGTYAFASAAMEGDAATGLVVKLRLQPPKVKRTVHVEPSQPHPTSDVHYAIVLDPSVSSAPPTDQVDFPILGAVLLIGTSQLPASITWVVDASSSSGTIDVGPDGAWAGTVPLSPGVNTVSLGIEGEGVLRTFEIVHNPGYAFAGSLDLFPDVSYIFPPEWGAVPGRLVTARILLSDPATVVDDVRLVRVWPDGSTTDVGALLDDGQAVILDDPFLGPIETGDDFASDGIFTLGFLSAPDEPGIEQYRVQVGTTGGTTALSDTSRLVAADFPDFVAWSERALEQAALQDELASAMDSGTLDVTLAQIESELAQDPSVDAVGRSGDGLGLWMLFADGTAGVLSVPADGIKGGGSVRDEPGARPAPRHHAPPSASAGGASRDAVTADRPDLVRGFVQPRLRPYTGQQLARAPWSRRAAAALPQVAKVTPLSAVAGDVTNAVQSARVLLYAANYNQWGDNDDIPALAEEFANEPSFDVEYLKVEAKGEATLDPFLSLGKYGVFALSSHGNTFFWDDTEEALEDKPQYGWNKEEGPGGLVAIYSNVDASAFSFEYADDLITGRLVFWGTTLGVTPSFIRTHNAALPNSIVYLSICRGTYNATMAQAFLEVGAGAVLGYSDYVGVSFCRTQSETFWSGMLEVGATVDDAHDVECENDGDPACFLRFGAADLELRPQGVIDPGFELPLAATPWIWWSNGIGDITQPFAEYDGVGGYTVGGLLKSWGPFKPTEGKQMAYFRHRFVGEPFVDEEGTSAWWVDAHLTSNSFELVPTLANSTMTFDWNYIWSCDLAGLGLQDWSRLLEAGTTKNGFGGAYHHIVADEAPCDLAMPVGFGPFQATGWRTFSGPLPIHPAVSIFDLVNVEFQTGAALYTAEHPIDAILLIDNLRID